MNILICPRCDGELSPGEAHDAELCALLAKFRSTALRHPNFGKRAKVMRPAAPNVSGPVPAAERRVAGIERSLPPEKDYGETVADPREFHARVDVSGALGILLEHLRRHIGQWCPMVELQRLMGVEMVHSRVAEARELIQDDEDIDQQSRMYEPTGKLHSFYRLCLKTESNRLRRLAEKQKRKQLYENKNDGKDRN